MLYSMLCTRYSLYVIKPAILPTCYIAYYAYSMLAIKQAI